MEEEDKKQEDEKKEGEPQQDTDKGSEPQTTELISRADAAAERLEAANKKQEELLKRQENLEARRAISGRSEMGGKEEKKEETPEEYARKLQSGEVNPLKDGK